ncbi:hypothetical protein [Bradyrhizobium septentrionale]|uniref:Uncharacterized protein n=1 Tax=Bradyrhizobium septentrionale TaxID=1404411 RepID=A0A974A3B8_9BRAD|nr:hypothetical protein [Bradyrhizobium septentrionale]UGY15624.1 hypothetical protein HAP48_0045140 [Bradyrhizobium septentrionale]UGY24200.1 hypothetical protein HU675_0040780 [Bradyrhizobium septentrionale]
MSDKQARARPTIRLWLLIAVAVAAFIGANAHLIYVATKSQPACVAHLKQGKAGTARGLFSAAQSSCSPSPPANADHS